MSSKKLADYEQAVKDQKISVWIRHHLDLNNTNMTELSRRLGQNTHYLRSLALRGDPKTSQLIALGNKLNANPFDTFRPLLNAAARPTRTETTQAARITELEAQILLLEKERDWLKEVVLKK